MNRHSRLTAYLDAVTSCFEGDDELRLDVRAELAAHLEEAAARFEAEGHSPEESAELAIKALGPATDYASELVAANRRRMRLRGRVGLLLRALVIPAALLAALISMRGFAVIANLTATVSGPVSLSGSAACSAPARLLGWLMPRDRGLSREQLLVLHGDPSRSDSVAAQRAIWEAWPTNVVYLNNYLSELYSRIDLRATPPDDRLAVLDRELDSAIAFDPQNARYLYMRAHRRFAQGATVETTDLGKDAKGESHSDLRLTVTDRAALDEAMAGFLTGTRKPVLRRYTSDMLGERLAILGPPESMLEQVRQTGEAAGVLLPDLGAYRNLARASLAYARLLLQEGRPDEARSFIDAWQPLSAQLADDSFTLIDILVAAAIANLGRDCAVTLYHEMGDPAAAALTLRKAEAFCAPVAAYKARIKAQDGNQAQLLEQRAGVMARVLLPAIGEPIAEAELRPGRMVEYILMDQATCGVANLLLLGALFAALLVTLWWRFIPGAAGAPLLLLPDGRQILRIVGYGVLLPLLLYALWTRLPLIGGRDVSLARAWPLAFTQAILLVAAITGLTTTVATRAVRARCLTLGVELPPFGDHRFGAPRFGLYRGTLARSLIPYLALAIVLTTVLTTPYLRATEARLVATDPLMATPPTHASAGFTIIESRLTDRLRGEMLKAAGR